MIEHSPLPRTLTVTMSGTLWGALPHPLPALSTALSRVKALMERRRVRNELASLDDRMLRDMGVSRYDIAQEIRKPF
jgi:uncharacterized protein YjiS (DUF1127 family)